MMGSTPFQKGGGQSDGAVKHRIQATSKFLNPKTQCKNASFKIILLSEFKTTSLTAFLKSKIQENTKSGMRFVRLI